MFVTPRLALLYSTIPQSRSEQCLASPQQLFCVGLNTPRFLLVFLKVPAFDSVELPKSTRGKLLISDEPPYGAFWETQMRRHLLDRQVCSLIHSIPQPLVTDSYTLFV